ncbi:MAG: hypothetical protein NTZ11_12410 [Gammaproteobacteria bacterium]|nr:hypothetical protein [Gammaproteobacteria bacterium]
MMNCDHAAGLLLQLTGTGLAVCGALLDDRQTQLLGSQMRHIGRLRMRRAADAAGPGRAPMPSAAVLKPDLSAELSRASANDGGA